MSPGKTGHITGQMGRVPGTDGTHTRGCPAEILYVYWFFSFPKNPKNPYPPNLGGEDFTPQIWGASARKHCKTSVF